MSLFCNNGDFFCETSESSVVFAARFNNDSYLPDLHSWWRNGKETAVTR